MNQTIDFIISANEFASQNKKLDIFIMTTADSTSNAPVESLLIGNLDLPVFYNTNTQLQNSAYLWKDFGFGIDFNQPMYLLSDNKLEVPMSGNMMMKSNSIKAGDCLLLNNLFVGTASIYDLSGQYFVDSNGGATNSYITIDVSTNPNFVAFGSSQSLPLTVHGTSSTLLSNSPYFSFNKGKRIKITCISNSTVLKERYQIQVQEIM